MKKKLLFFIPLLLFLFIPKNANAALLTPREIFVANSDGKFVNSTSDMHSFYYSGTNYYGIDPWGTLTKRSGILFGFSSSTLEPGKHYSVQFSILSTDFPSSYNNPYVVSMQNLDGSMASCRVYSNFEDNGDLLITGNTYGGRTAFSNVYCEDFYLVRNDMQIFNILINGYFYSTKGASFAISAITLSPTPANELSSNVQKNTDEIKKQTEETKKNTEETKKQTETIKDSDTTGAKDSANSFFGDFQSDDYGLSDIVTMPLTFVQGLANNSCNSLVLPMPFIKQNVELPCMTSVYKSHFNSFLQLYQLITTGFIAYWICINIFRLVQNFKNPDNDEVEVLDL